MNTTLSDIEKKIEEYAAKINASKDLLPAFGNGVSEVQPNISMDAKGKFHYEIYERGQLIKDEIAVNENDLYYFIFRDISFSISMTYKLQNSNPRKDFRRILFARQSALMEVLDESWKERIQKDQQLTLQSNPFDDNSIRRMDYYSKLKQMGKTNEQAMSESNKKFPAPKH